jgi:sec-independent protein translocase protein TatB
VTPGQAAVTLETANKPGARQMLNISWGEFLVLIVAGLFILGPERLPGAARWLGRAVSQAREYATGAQQRLRSELGSEFDELREPLETLRTLRGLDPRTALTKHLLDATGGYDPREDLRLVDLPGIKPNGFPAPQPPRPQRALSAGERPPFDPEAT